MGVSNQQTGIYNPFQQGQMPQGLRSGPPQGMPQGQMGVSTPQTGMYNPFQQAMGRFGGPMGGFGGPMGVMGGGFGGPMGGMGGYPQQAMGGLLGGMQGGCPPWMPGCGGGGYGGGWSGAAPMYGGARGQLQPPAPVQQQAPIQQPTAPTTSPNGTTVGYSDAQLKTDIEPMEDGLELVSRIRPVRFKWMEGEGEQAAGMTAQQVEEVFPEAVVEMGDGYKGIDSLAVIGALVGAVNALTTRLEALEEK
jgi:hypothetical protein